MRLLFSGKRIFFGLFPGDAKKIYKYGNLRAFTKLV